MKFYNTLTRNKDEFVPLKDNTAQIYSCGPTVYQYAHIGNMRTYIFMDLLRRSLKYNGYKLKHVMNITDVGHLVSDGDEGEDKMAKSAVEQKKTPWEIADYYTGVFMRDIDLLNIEHPEIILKVTDNIQKMIDFIAGLEKAGYAYETSDGIYYDIMKFKDYGKLSRNIVEDLQAGARIEVNEEKHHPADFALWKKASKEHIMQWESPWGMGYPGWHIECSALALEYLGEEFDIHTGGVDHIPIHHENEIAQTEGLLGHPSVRIWMHGEFMLVDGGKMSKSLGNGYTIGQLKEKGYEADEFRYFCLNAHYRQKLNFTFEGMEGAKKALRNLRTAVLKHKNAGGGIDGSVIETYRSEFAEAVNDDLNIPKALGVVWTAARHDVKSAGLYEFILKCDTVLGLRLDKPLDENIPEEDTKTLDDEIAAMIKARDEAKKTKNYAEADRIRGDLADRGIQLIDTPEGTKWILKSK